jgi:hypothetical protein
MAPLGGMERACRKVRFARLIHRHGRAFGGPTARAAFGGNQMQTTSPLTVATAGLPRWYLAAQLHPRNRRDFSCTH